MLSDNGAGNMSLDVALTMLKTSAESMENESEVSHRECSSVESSTFLKIIIL